MDKGKRYQIVCMKQLPAALRSTLIAFGMIPGQTFHVEYLSMKKDLIHIRTNWGDAYGLSLTEMAQIGTIEYT